MWLSPWWFQRHKHLDRPTSFSPCPFPGPLDVGQLIIAHLLLLHVARASFFLALLGTFMLYCILIPFPPWSRRAARPPVPLSASASTTPVPIGHRHRCESPAAITGETARMPMQDTPSRPTVGKTPPTNRFPGRKETLSTLHQILQPRLVCGAVAPQRPGWGPWCPNSRPWTRSRMQAP